MTDLRNPIVQLSTEELPARDRVSRWREHFGRIMLRVDIEPSREVPFCARIRSLPLPGLLLMEGSSSPVRISRRGQHLSDGNDDVVLAVNRTGAVIVESGGREQTLREGDAIVLSGSEPAAFDRRSSGQSLTLRVPRAIIEATPWSIDELFMRPIVRDRSALKLLTNYAGWLLDSGGTIGEQPLALAARHVQDLLALAIGNAPDFGGTARTRGLRAARLKLAKAYIVSHSQRRDISIGSVAASLHVTARYLQRLFEADGTTFSEFLMRQRLARAHRLLSEPAAQKMAISSIAYEVGFGDLSHFNRRFRHQFGLTPGEVRYDRA